MTANTYCVSEGFSIFLACGPTLKVHNYLLCGWFVNDSSRATLLSLRMWPITVYSVASSPSLLLFLPSTSCCCVLPAINPYHHRMICIMRLRVVDLLQNNTFLNVLVSWEQSSSFGATQFTWHTH